MAKCCELKAETMICAVKMRGLVVKGAAAGVRVGRQSKRGGELFVNVYLEQASLEYIIHTAKTTPNKNAT